MKLFFSHAHEDKGIVEKVGKWFQDLGFDVWIDSWEMTAGDSIIQKISEGIDSSDRLIVFLSQHSIESNWVKKELSTGLVIELAKEKKYDEKFVIPVKIGPCKVPVLLNDKLWIDFTTMPFESACNNLKEGVLNKKDSFNTGTINNSDVRIWNKQIGNRYFLTIEFFVRYGPSEGLQVGVDTGSNFDSVKECFNKPNDPVIPEDSMSSFFNTITKNEPPIYARKFASPGITATRSYYLSFESNEPFNVTHMLLVDFYGNEIN
jgi:hypothetical protein